MEKSRLLRVRLATMDTKERILKNAAKLKKNATFSDVYINPDLTPAQQERNYKLRMERKRQRDVGIDAVIYKGEVVTRNSTPVFHL